jgi:cobalt-zinc-cadmium resistance protein CzcA
MIERILSGSVRYRWLVLFLTAIVAIIGAWQLNLLPIDVTPDITNKQVQINTVVPTMSPVEVEKRVTYPIETAISGLNGVEHALDVAQRLQPGDRDLQGEREPVLHAPAGNRTAGPGASEPAGKCRAADGTGFDGAGRGLPLQRRVPVSGRHRRPHQGRRAGLAERRQLSDRAWRASG